MCHVANESIKQTSTNLFMSFAIVVASLYKISHLFEVLVTQL